MTSPIHVALAADANYIHYTTVALYSLLAHASRPVKATILAHGVCEADRQKLLRSCAQFGPAIAFIDVDMRTVDDLPVLSARMSRAAYFRIFLPHLLGEEVEKILYLDSDTLCVGDIAPLWDTDVSRHAVAAVRDLVLRKDDSFLRWKSLFPGRRAVRRLAEAHSFNSGLMLMNLKRWRAENLATRILDWRRKRANLTTFHDQDALNAILADSWLQLSARWNFGSWFVHRSRFFFPWNRKRLDPRVLHFTGSYLYRAYRVTYHRYVAQTEWKDEAGRFFGADQFGGLRRVVKWNLRGLHVACFPFLYGPATEFGLVPREEPSIPLGLPAPAIVPAAQ